MEEEEQAAINQPSTSNFTNVDEQGQPIGARPYNVQGDLVINQYRGPPPVDVKALAEKLKQKLIVRANEVVGETILPIHLEQAIERVQLQISTVIQRSDADWNKSHDWQNHMERKSLDTIYQSNASRISIDQIFTKAKETATMEAEKQCKSDAAKELYIKQHGNTISLVGLPGIGKSTLSKMVTKSILDKIISPDTEYLFYISMKNVNFKKKVTTLQFLIDNGMSMFPTHSHKENKAVIDMLQNNHNVVIVMDGLDEAATKFSKKTHRCTINGKEKPVDIVMNLLNGNLLPNAIKLVTSRPGQFYQIHPDCRPTFVLEVLGLDQNAIDSLGSQICGERYPEIKKYLKERPNLSALCYVPVNCILIMACLIMCLSTGKEINSMTQVLIYALTHYITSEHLKSDMTEEQISLELVKLSQLAFKGFKKQKLVFNIKDFKKVRIKETMANNFMHTYVDKASGMRIKILEGHKRSYFSHLTWQEFLTAVYMMLFMPYQQFQRYSSIFEEFQWEVVARFMFGICKPTSKTDLELIFPTSEIKDFKEKKKMILDIISRQQIDPKKDHFNALLGKVSGWMHELDDKEIIKQVEQCLPTDITMKVPPNPTQARDLAFAFKSCSAPHNLTVQADEHAAPETTTFLRGLQGSTMTRVNIIYG